MSPHRQRSVTAVLLALLATLLLAVGVHGHGGGELVVARAPVGPYFVSVWVNPPQPLSGQPTHFTVGIADQVDEAPVLDAAVTVTVRSLDDATAVFEAPATTAQSANKLFYETDLDLDTVGIYAATVAVAGAAGTGNTTFELQVLPPSRVNWLLIGLGAFGLVVVWIVWRSRRS